MAPATNNALSLFGNNVAAPGTMSAEQFSVAATMYHVVQQAANGTPMAVKKTKDGIIIHKAKICSVCVDDVSSHGYYHCAKCHHEICSTCYVKDRGCDAKKGHSSYVYRV